MLPEGRRLTLHERADAFNAAFAKWPASHLHVVQEKKRDVLYGRWLIGNDYRNKTRYYGAYPAGYLQRVMAIFPDSTTPLHVFSGSLPPSDDYDRVDINPGCAPDIQCSVYDLPEWVGTDPIRHRLLVLADPPYSSADAEKYGAPMVDRRRVMAALALITRPTGHLVWLDTCWPIHRKAQWVTVGRITLLRSTNHRVREITIFERTAEPSVECSNV